MAPLADVNGYKAFWHPYDGHNLPYRLLYPYNYDPEQSYPLLVFTGGSGECGTDNIDQLTWSIAQSFHAGNDDDVEPTASYSEWPCFVICPQCPDNDSDIRYDLPALYTFERTFHTLWWNVRPTGWYIAAVLDLVAEIQQSGFHFYNEADLSGEDLVVPDCNINSNKIYCMGASLGGLACYAFAKEGRDVWAAIIPCKAFNVGAAYKDYYREESDDYNAEYLLRHQREYERIYHIPQLLIDYQGDDMYEAMQGLHAAQLEVLESMYGLGSASIPQKLLFISLAGGNHASTGDFNSIFTPSNLMDITDPDEQQYGGALADTNPMDWLFAQTKPTCPPDPYPDEEETYYPERSYAVISNDTVENSVYTGQRTTIACDKTKDVRVRVAGVETDVVFADGLYVHSQFVSAALTMVLFRLHDNGVVGQVYKLSPRTAFIGV